MELPDDQKLLLWAFVKHELGVDDQESIMSRYLAYAAKIESGTDALLKRAELWQQTDKITLPTGDEAASILKTIEAAKPKKELTFVEKHFGFMRAKPGEHCHSCADHALGHHDHDHDHGHGGHHH